MLDSVFVKGSPPTGDLKSPGARRRAGVGVDVGKRKGERTEEAFLRAAREVFARDGYLNSKITEIARVAGRSPGSLYNYYENKAELLDALLEEFSRDVTEASLQSRSDHPYESIRGAVRAYWTNFRDHLPEMIGLFQMSMTDRGYAERWRAVRALGIQGILAQLERAQRDGYLAGADLPTTASAIMSMLESFTWTWLAGIGDAGVPRPDDDTAIAALTNLWYGAVYGPVVADAHQASVS